MNTQAEEIDRATELLKASNNEAALVEAVRWNEQLVEHSQPGIKRHLANMKLCDALAALHSFRARRDDPQ